MSFVYRYIISLTRRSFFFSECILLGRAYVCVCMCVLP